LRYCVEQNNFGAVLAITHQHSDRALQPAEKEHVRRAILYAETHHASGDIKQVLRDFCPEIGDDVRKALNEREEMQRKERREREAVQMAVKQAQREENARRAEERRQEYQKLLALVLFSIGIVYLLTLVGLA
jgi:hypothetical protein